MTNTLQIEFAPDMPVAAVEVIAPDLTVVRRMMMAPGLSRSIDVPSDESFLRVHLPDGSVLTLDSPGQQRRIVTRAQLLRPASEIDETAAERALSGSQLFSLLDPELLAIDGAAASDHETSIPELARGDSISRSAPRNRKIARKPLDAGAPLQMPSDDALHLIGAKSASVKKQRGGYRYTMPAVRRYTDEPLALRFITSDEVAVEIAVPASALNVGVRVTGSGRRKRLRIAVETSSPHADAILAYLSRGDMYAASALAEWTDEAEQLVYQDDSDPYSGVVGAYLLLRLREFSRMRDWVREIAIRFPFLSDGYVIWAWQLVHLHQGKSSEARDYFFRACELPLPVYSEGLRLLLDGLCLFGDAGQQLRQTVLERSSQAVLSSPLLTQVSFGDDPSARAPAVELEFGG